VHLRKGLKKALNNIGIGKKEAGERGLHLHAWRHFLNTELQKAGITVQKVQAVTGHKSERMTEYYTHFDPMEFGEVPQVQAALLSGKPEVKKDNRHAFALVKKPEASGEPSVNAENENLCASLLESHDVSQEIKAS
jgi:hypothetical protein